MEDPVMDGQAAATAVPTRHVCHYPDCGKTFIRKEHLTRHEKSHAPQRSFVCYVCQRAFTRNDILRRHIIRHNNSVRATARNGRACDGCHSSKIKCEGGQPCSPCTKRGMECKFERDEVTIVRDALSKSAIGDDEDDNIGTDVIPPTSKNTQSKEQQHSMSGSSRDQHSHSNGTNGPTTIANYDAAHMSSAPILQMSTFDMPGSFLSYFERGGATQQMPTPGNEDLLNFENIYSVNEKTFPITLGPWGYPISNTPLRSIPKSVTKERYELFLDHFHHRWPVIHIPSFEKGDEPYVLSASVEMIGAWLQGSEESKLVAITLHDRLTNHIFQRLYQKPLYADRYKPWPIPFYQATLLNIICAFYFGEQSVLSRAGLLRSMLISSLRGLGFFRTEIASFQENDAKFYPYIISKQEERKRLAVSLFKIDCYLSLIRDEPMTLRCEELCFPLPTTFCVFNGPGLHMLEARLPEEPVQRSQETVSSMIGDLSFSSIMQPFVLVEDIQLGICASQAAVWQYCEKIQCSLEHDITSLIQQKSMRDGINSWKRVFDQTAIQESEQATPGKTNNIPMKYYYGIEDHSEVGWQEIVLNRPRTLLFDTGMLYHLFGLHIHANIRSLTTLALSKKFYRTAAIRTSTVDRFPEDRARQWTTVVCSRQALWHASNVLAMHRARHGQMSSPVHTLDPIAHAAVAFSSLVVWAYCSFSEKGCTRCMRCPGLSRGFELLDLLTSTEKSEKWVELGGPATLDDFSLCLCDAEKLVRVFQACLPPGVQKWAFAESLSPVLEKST